MASREYYHDIDLVKVGQLVNARIQNVTTTERNTLGSSLGSGNVGIQVFDTTIAAPFIWDGSAWVRDALTVSGDVVYKGTINPSNAGTVNKDSGFQYVVDTAGTLTASGVTFSPSGVVEVGDIVLFTSATDASVIQRNVEGATDAVAGIIELATQSEVNTGSDTTRAITPATLAGSNLASDVSTNQSNISTLQTDVSNLQTYAANNAGDIATLQTQVTNLQTYAANNASDIATNATDIGTLQTQMTAVQTYAANNASDIATLQTDVTALQTYAANNAGDISTLQTQMTAVQTFAANNAADIATLQSTVSSLSSSAVKVYSNANVAISQGSATTITHNLDLSDPNFFTIRVADTNGSSISVDIDAVTSNTITLTSLVALSGVKVYIVGS